MQKDRLAALFFIVFVCFGALNLWASDNKEKGNTPEDRKTEVSAYVKHHNLDTHDFGLFSYTDDQGAHHSVGFPLPVILWSDGLHVFSSSALHHGESVVASNGKFFKLDSHTYKI